MFSTLGLFQSLPCPRKHCTLCPFSHSSVPAQPTAPIATPTDPPSTVPAKRPLELTIPAPDPPPQRIKTATAPKSVVSQSTSQTSVRYWRSVHPVSPHTRVQTGVPTLRINAAQSRVPLPVRQVRHFSSPQSITHPIQAMLKSLYDHFVVLYESLLPAYPTLASEHALRQEEQVYNKSTKLTYRNVRRHFLLVSLVSSLLRLS